MANIKTSWELLIKYLWSISAKQTNFYIMEQKTQNFNTFRS